mmetsp:Transcript_175395/g.562680  ORF Transcript_175395/g.562680 Transcript_175395/m.562680 type:complete len:230 (-) Transcript_175395:16-705(-)
MMFCTSELAHHWNLLFPWKLFFDSACSPILLSKRVISGCQSGRALGSSGPFRPPLTQHGHHAALGAPASAGAASAERPRDEGANGAGGALSDAPYSGLFANSMVSMRSLTVHALSLTATTPLKSLSSKVVGGSDPSPSGGWPLSAPSVPPASGADRGAADKRTVRRCGRISTSGRQPELATCAGRGTQSVTESSVCTHVAAMAPAPSKTGKGSIHPNLHPQALGATPRL